MGVIYIFMFLFICIYGLFNNANSSSSCIALNNKMLNEKLIGKKRSWPAFNVFFRLLPGGNENYEKP
jgi:hypothetical protein